MFIAWNLSAQKVKRTVDDNPRVDKYTTFAPTLGVKNMTGIGMNISYYATPKIAIDFGHGIGLRNLKFGIGGRYLFFHSNFTPYVGGSLFYHPFWSDFIIVSYQGVKTTYLDINPALFGRIALGLELMTFGDFVMRVDFGITRAFTDKLWYSNFPISDDLQRILDVYYDEGYSFGFFMGYAF